MNVIAPSGVGIKIIENVINVIKDKLNYHALTICDSYDMDSI